MLYAVIAFFLDWIGAITLFLLVKQIPSKLEPVLLFYEVSVF